MDANTCRQIFLIFGALFVQHFLLGCNAIEVDVFAPSTITVGSSGILDCKWTSQPHQEVYSVKWYQKLREIYRYTPSKYPDSIQLFRNDYLQVDRRTSDQGKIHVTNVTLEADGLFRCEVSGEGPSFYTVYGAVNISIVSPPRDNPTIHGGKRIYNVGDWIDLRCETSESKPPPNLTFYVNEQQAHRNWMESPLIYPTQNGLYKSSLRMRFTLEERMLDYEGLLRVRCAAEIIDVYQGSTNIVLKSERFSPSLYGGTFTFINPRDFQEQQWRSRYRMELVVHETCRFRIEAACVSRTLVFPGCFILAVHLLMSLSLTWL